MNFPNRIESHPEPENIKDHSRRRCSDPKPLAGEALADSENFQDLH